MYQFDYTEKDPSTWSVYLITALYVSLVTVSNLGLLSLVNYRDIGMIYLMAVTVGSVFIKNYNVIFASILSGICWNVFFMPPRFTFIVQHHEDILLLMLYLVAGLVIGFFTNKLRKNERILKTEGQRANQLYSITKELSVAKNLDQMIKAVQEQLFRIFSCDVAIFLRPLNSGEHAPLEQYGNFQINEDEIIEWVMRNRTPAGKFTGNFPSSRAYFVPVPGSKLSLGVLVLNFSERPVLTDDQALVIDAASRQLGSGIEREHLQEELRNTLVTEESERIYKTLLSSVSHEIRTPLAAIKGFASTLSSPEVVKSPEKVHHVAGEISEGVERLDYVVQHLLDMSRLESGKLKLHLDYLDIKELLTNAIGKVKGLYPGRQVTLKAAEDLQFFYLDYFLVEQSIENILRNACTYTPADTLIEVEVSTDAHYLYITITDYGSGISGSDPNMIFNKFYRGNPKETGGIGLGLSICKAVIELHRGHISVNNVKGGGAKFLIRLPLELDRELVQNG